MSPAKVRFYIYLQTIPLLACVFTAWLSYNQHRLLASGKGDFELVGYGLLLLPVLYVILPPLFVLDLYTLWQSVRTKDYRQTAAVLAGLVFIAATYLIFLSMF